MYTGFKQRVRAARVWAVVIHRSWQEVGVWELKEHVVQLEMSADEADALHLLLLPYYPELANDQPKVQVRYWNTKEIEI